MTPEQRAKMDVDARMIAGMIARTSVEDRPALYTLVSESLDRRFQNYQASLFRELAKAG